jgi:hypothetical protein
MGAGQSPGPGAARRLSTGRPVTDHAPPRRERTCRLNRRPRHPRTSLDVESKRAGAWPRLAAAGPARKITGTPTATRVLVRHCLCRMRSPAAGLPSLVARSQQQQSEDVKFTFAGGGQTTAQLGSGAHESRTRARLSRTIVLYLVRGPTEVRAVENAATDSNWDFSVRTAICATDGPLANCQYTRSPEAARRSEAAAHGEDVSSRPARGKPSQRLKRSYYFYRSRRPRDIRVGHGPRAASLVAVVGMRPCVSSRDATASWRVADADDLPEITCSA